MPLTRIGIDEAGYGPNLGPLVVSAVACRVEDESGDPWQIFAQILGRAGAARNGGLIVDDSKKVYGKGLGIKRLETSVLALLTSLGAKVGTVGELVDWVTGRAEIHREPWFIGDTPLPIAASLEEIADGANKLASIAGARFTAVHSRVVGVEDFNGVVDRFQSKGAVLARCFVELLQTCRAEMKHALHVLADKHGGRDRYGVMIQEAVGADLVLPREEGALRSVYDVMGGDAPLRVVFAPRADGEDLCVAWASMVSKYLREMLMIEFNRFWEREIPGLKPTAGYPVDAKRYYDAIRPALARLGIAEAAVWRKR